MNKIIALSLILAIGLISCKKSDKGIDKLEIAKKYYKSLDNSDDFGMVTILGDSIIIRESEDDYEEYFSRKGYVEWLKWDAVFDPTYKILEIEQENETIKTKISKIDKRIFFLHEEPMVWYEILRFDHNKIIKIDRIKYEIFDIPKFVKNRDGLVSWIDENYPELNGFLNAQTKSIGMKYLKAIELYENKK